MTEVIYTHGVIITVRRPAGLADMLPLMALGRKAIRLLENREG